MLLSSVLRRPARCIGVRSLLVISCLVLVLVLVVIVLLYVINYRPGRIVVQPLEVHFVNPLSPRDMELFNRTLRIFVESVEAANLTYFIYGGTLLGSLRHHNRIPWDDDVDILMHDKDKPLIEKTLSKLYPDYGIHKAADYVWKFYPTVGRYMYQGNHRSPYVDLAFYDENQTHLWNVAPFLKGYEMWPKEKVFPLHRRPFGDLSVTAPCNGLAVMGRYFDIGVCTSRSTSHVVDLYLTPWSLPCSRLAHLYPFVRSHQMNGSSFVQETLMLGDRQIKNFTARAPC